MNPLRKLFTPSVADRLLELDLPTPGRPAIEDATYAVVRLELAWGAMEPTPEQIERARAVHSRLAAHVMEHGWGWDTLLGSHLLFRCAPLGEHSAERNAVLTARSALHALRVESGSGAARGASAAVGIATGPVILGSWGCKDRVCCAALGPTVDRALSLAQAARPGEIALDAATHTALGDLTRYPWEGLHFTRSEHLSGPIYLSG